MGQLAELGFAIVFGTVGIYTLLISIDAYFKHKQRKDLWLAALGFGLAALGVSLIVI